MFRILLISSGASSCLQVQPSTIKSAPASTLKNRHDFLDTLLRVSRFHDFGLMRPMFWVYCSLYIHLVVLPVRTIHPTTTRNTPSGPHDTQQQFKTKSNTSHLAFGTIGESRALPVHVRGPAPCRINRPEPFCFADATLAATRGLNARSRDRHRRQCLAPCDDARKKAICLRYLLDSVPFTCCGPLTGALAVSYSNKL